MKIRRCPTCKVYFELTPQNFCSDSSKPMGLSYRCKVCTNKIKRGTRKDRWWNMTASQKQRKAAVNRKYTSFGKGRAIAMLNAYRKIDKSKHRSCDIDLPFLMAIFSMSCVYCGDTDRLGCDRVDNSIGHLKSNVVPCCATCNISRMNNFTHSEMFIIGKAVREVKLSRANGSTNDPKKYK